MGSGREFLSDLLRGVGASLAIVSVGFIFLFLAGAMPFGNMYHGGLFVGLFLPIFALGGGVMFMAGLAMDRPASRGEDIVPGLTLANGGSTPEEEPEVGDDRF